MSNFNLNSLSLKDTTELHLKNPDTEELLYADDAKKKPVVIVLFGTASKQYRDAITSMQNRSLKRGKKVVSAEVMKEEGIALLVACSDSAKNLDYNGAPLVGEAFRDMYNDPTVSWVKDQVDAALGDVSSFL